MQSAEMLKLLIARRLQSEARGGLDPDTKMRLGQKRMPVPSPPPIGTKLAREYQGVVYTAEIAPDGVLFAGATYGSLTEVAEKITGTRWNGPRFFGLRPRRARD